MSEEVFAPAADTFAAELTALVPSLNARIGEINSLSTELEAIGVVALPLTFSTTTTDADPGTGILRLSSATQNASTVIRIDNLDANAADISAQLAAFGTSTSTIKGTLTVAHRDTPTTKFLKFNITAVASPAGYRNITGTCVAFSAASPFADADPLTVSFVRNGDSGGITVAEFQNQTYISGTTAGTSTAYTLTPSVAISAYTANQRFHVTFHAASGASPTLQISGVATPPNLVRQLRDGTYRNIAANEIPINHRSRVSLLSATQALVEDLPQDGWTTVTVVDRAFAEYTTNADITTTIPFDDTIPQNTEGVQIVTASITPKTTNSRIRFRFQGQFVCGSTGINAIAAVFVNSVANAIKASFNSNSGAGFSNTFYIEGEYLPASTSAQTFAVRVGAQGGQTIRLNGSATARTFGGVMGATLVLEEIL
jgi:hypothetical protein